MKKSLCIIFLFIGISLSAQDISLKTNLLYDISTTFNLGAEFRLARNGRWMFPRTIILLHFQTVRSGNTGWHSPKHGIGCVRRLTDTSLVCTCLEGNLTWATWNSLWALSYYQGLSVWGILLRRRLVLRLSVDIGQPLEPGSEHRCRLCTEPLR